MYSRIRYTKQNNDKTLFKSTKSFNHPTNGSSYCVILDLKEHKWSVVESRTEIVATSGHITDLNKMKNEAKNALVTLGVEFVSETGQRKEYTRKQNVTKAA